MSYLEYFCQFQHTISPHLEIKTKNIKNKTQHYSQLQLYCQIYAFQLSPFETGSLKNNKALNSETQQL